MVALQIMDSRVTGKPLPVNRLEANQRLGIESSGWRMVFPRAPPLLSRRLELSASLSPVQVLVTGLATGQWLCNSARSEQVLTDAPGEHQVYLTSGLGLVEFSPASDLRVTIEAISSPQ